MAGRRGKGNARRKAADQRRSTARRRPRPAAATRAARRPTPARLAKKATERQQAHGPDGERIRPSHWRYCHAKLELAERGTAPTAVAIAKVLGINRVTVYRLLYRYPWLDGWVDGMARAAAVHQYGLILIRHGNLAIQGSVQSADLVCKMEGGYYTRNAGGMFGDEGTPQSGPVVVNINSLVPRPDYAGVARELSPALPAGPLPSKIPVVNVR